MGGLTQEAVLAALTQHGVEFQKFEHAPVMTADAQAEALKSAAAAGGVVTKNLFLQDKAQKQYLITALPDTKVDLKVLSARLGLSKGTLKWGSEELLAGSLQVEPGCVTPLAVANPSAKHVLLLLDAKLQSCGKRFFVHPIVNTASVLLNTAGLDAFIKGVGRQPCYVDLEANPKIDRDHPADLKQYADAIEAPPKAVATPEQGQAQASSSSSGAQPAAAAAAAGKAASKKAGAAGGSTSKGKQQQRQRSADEQHIKLTNVVQRTEDIVDMVARALMGKAAGEAGAEPYVLRRLKADVQMELTAFKNSAFTSGYNAGKGEVVAFATKQYA